MEEQKITRFRLFLLFPLFVVAAAWALDKQFFIGTFPDYYLRTGSFINYRHKLDLTDELQLYLAKPDRRKTLVLFGNSRTMAFDNAYIEAKNPDWILFNFSVPGGTTDYFYYVLQRFKDKNIRPDFVVLAVTPQGFNAAPASAMDEVMLEGLPTSFVLRYANRYSIDDLGNYFAKTLFWSYQYRPKPGVILQRTENDALLARTYNQFRARTYVLLSDNRGSTPGGQVAAPNDEYLEASAKGIFRQFFTPFSMHNGQLRFTEDAMRLTQSMQVPSILLWARVAPQLRRMKDRTPLPGGSTVRTTWQPYMENIAARYHAGFLDMNFGPSIKCDDFYDASHMAANCFPEFTDFLFDNVKRMAGRR